MSESSQPSNDLLHSDLSSIGLLCLEFLGWNFSAFAVLHGYERISSFCLHLKPTRPLPVGATFYFPCPSAPWFLVSTSSLQSSHLFSLQLPLLSSRLPSFFLTLFLHFRNALFSNSLVMFLKKKIIIITTTITTNIMFLVIIIDLLKTSD